MLTRDDIASYLEDGLIVLDYRIPDDALASMRELLDGMLQANEDLSADYLGALTQHHSGWLEFAKLPQILDSVSSLLGDDIALWTSTLFGKPARGGKATAWHQDGQYWPIKPLATCSVWVALDDSNQENGCLRYIPGSHRPKKLWRHDTSDSDQLTLNQVLDNEAFDESTARDVVLEAGQISIHDAYLIHGSQPNHSSQRRAGVVYRYMPTTSHFDHAYAFELSEKLAVPDQSQRPLYLLRGQDRCGLNNYSVGHE
jgi:ectoine hydroxylase-related dioxygenase (phytanoyl-CoA dioxygenase family)